MNDVTGRLKAADPLRNVMFEPLPPSAVQALVEESIMTATYTPAPATAIPPDVKAERRRRRRRRIAAALVTAAAVAVPTAAVAGNLGMHTGHFAGPNDTLNVPGEEVLDDSSPEIRGVVTDLTKEFTLPSGTTWAPLLAKFPRSGDAASMVQRSELGGEVQFYATCAWYRDWDTGNAARRAADAATIAAIPSWKYWHFAKDSATGEDPGGDLLRVIAAQTAAGDPTLLRTFLRTNC